MLTIMLTATFVGPAHCAVKAADNSPVAYSVRQDQIVVESRSASITWTCIGRDKMGNFIRQHGVAP